MDPVDLREREDFVLEACALMRDRFQPVQVWEHFGIDVDQAKKAFLASPGHGGVFRSLLFSKVVPNLRKLGLLTPRVRDGFEQLGILKYERYIDSATEAGELDPDDGEVDNLRSADRAADLPSADRADRFEPVCWSGRGGDKQRLHIEPASIRLQRHGHRCRRLEPSTSITTGRCNTS